MLWAQARPPQRAHPSSYRFPHLWFFMRGLSFSTISNQTGNLAPVGSVLPSLHIVPKLLLLFPNTYLGGFGIFRTPQAHLRSSRDAKPSLHRNSFFLVPRCDGSPSFIVRKVSVHGLALRVFEDPIPTSSPRPPYSPASSLSITDCSHPTVLTGRCSLLYPVQWIFFSLILMQGFHFVEPHPLSRS